MSDATQKKRKVFGLGLGKNQQSKTDEPTEKDDDKWLEGISSQFNESSDDELDVRAISLHLIMLDPTNPRELDIDPEDITSNIEALRLPANALNDDSDEWVEDYRKQVFSVFGETKKALDFLNVAMFAADLKSPNNLINPISVWRDETSFFLFAGERRYLAHLLLQVNQIYTRIWDCKPDLFDMRILQWQENNLRENLSLHEKLKNIRQILEEWDAKYPDKNLTVRYFTRLVSMKRSQAACYLRVAKSESASLINAIKLGTVSTIELASELAGLNKDIVDSYLSRMDSGETITKELISKEKNEQSSQVVEKEISGPLKKPKRQFALKLNSSANQKPVAFIVNTLVEKINSESLSSIINSYDLENPKELSKALNSLLEFIEEEGISK